MAERVARAAEDKGITTSDVIRDALKMFLGVDVEDVDDERVLQVLAERAARGNTAAARELLRHRRWEIDRRRLVDEPAESGVIADLLRRRDERRAAVRFAELD